MTSLVLAGRFVAVYTIARHIEEPSRFLWPCFQKGWGGGWGYIGFGWSVIASFCHNFVSTQYLEQIHRILNTKICLRIVFCADPVGVRIAFLCIIF